jgi:hypothetical protein
VLVPRYSTGISAAEGEREGEHRGGTGEAKGACRDGECPPAVDQVIDEQYRAIRQLDVDRESLPSA